MKDKDSMWCIALLLILIMGVGTLYAVQNMYYRDGIVIHTDTDTAVVKDFSGNESEFIGSGYTVNESVRLLMNTKGTDDIYDDVVVQCFKD